MPLPLGHTAIGIALHDVAFRNNSVPKRLVLLVFITVLANLPDLDVLLGLFLSGNGNAYHRGPTHSIMFAFLMGFVASNTWKLWSQIPKMNFISCFMIILSHVSADFFLSHSSVSFFWPLHVSWAAGYRGWSDVITLAFLGAFRDVGIILICGVIMISNRVVTQIRHYAFGNNQSG